MHPKKTHICMNDTFVSTGQKSQKYVPRVRIELTTFRLLDLNLDYETDALPTALPRHMSFAMSSVCLYDSLG